MAAISDRRIYWAVGIGVAFCLFGNQGFRRLAIEMLEKRRVQKALGTLRGEHERLIDEWTLIRQDPSYAEYWVRKQLGYIKKGEVEYRFIKKSSDR